MSHGGMADMNFIYIIYMIQQKTSKDKNEFEICVDLPCLSPNLGLTHQIR